VTNKCTLKIYYSIFKIIFSLRPSKNYLFFANWSLQAVLLR